MGEAGAVDGLPVADGAAPPAAVGELAAGVGVAGRLVAGGLAVEGGADGGGLEGAGPVGGVAGWVGRRRTQPGRIRPGWVSARPSVWTTPWL
ncbi:hypothetical protein, partial [Frankia sp. AvcI1]|uniref:hypothetical protein n=1 Tax=Frankia sp. AvcI1 TaxID=573496 RepID=UPI0022859820